MVSFMTVAELDRWALERDWGETRRTRMERHMRNFVVYPFKRSLCLRWAEAADSARRNGRPIGVADAWIAATALEYDIPLVTNNASHYAGVESLTVIAEITHPE